MPTRWRTRTEADNFYSEHFETVKLIVAKFPSEPVVSVRESQRAFTDPKVACSVAYIRSNFDWFPESIKCLETQGVSLQDPYGHNKMQAKILVL
jgi:hypothetical protein